MSHPFCAQLLSTAPPALRRSQSTPTPAFSAALQLPQSLPPTNPPQVVCTLSCVFERDWELLSDASRRTRTSRTCRHVSRGVRCAAGRERPRGFASKSRSRKPCGMRTCSSGIAGAPDVTLGDNLCTQLRTKKCSNTRTHSRRDRRGPAWTRRTETRRAEKWCNVAAQFLRERFDTARLIGCVRIGGERRIGRVRGQGPMQLSTARPHSVANCSSDRTRSLPARASPCRKSQATEAAQPWGSGETRPPGHHCS